MMEREPSVTPVGLDADESRSGCVVPGIFPEYDLDHGRVRDGRLGHNPRDQFDEARPSPDAVIGQESWQAEFDGTDDWGGVVYIHVVDVEEKRRISLHGAMSRRSNAAVLTYRSAADFLSHNADVEAGCVLLSCDQFDEANLDILTRMTLDSRFAVVVLTTQADVRTGILAMKRGAADFLTWPYSAAELGEAVNLAIGKVRQRLAVSGATARAQERIARLSTREREVLHGLLEGKSNKMIALELRISPRTVEIYRAHLMDKLGVRSLSDVLKIALSAGMDFLGSGADEDD